jgi:hypothetical protein
MAMMKKAKPGVSLRSGQLKRIGRLEAKNPDRATNVAKRMVERDTRKERGQDFVTKNLDKLMPKRAKSGGSFPDLSKDGKITQKDILIGKGVLPKTAKSGATMMKMGGKMAKQAAVAIAMKKAGKAPKKKMQYGGEAASMGPMMKSGGKMKKCKYGCK